MSRVLTLVGLTTFLLSLPLPVAPAQEPKKKPARLKLLVPALTELEIEGHKTKSTGETRLFVTPPLDPGKKYAYTLKLSWTQADRRVVRMAVADVRAGEETVLDLRSASKGDASSHIVFVPTPDRLVEKMLEMAEVKKDDVVYDLGCGDGRIVILAAKKYGARGVGIDIDPARVKEAREAVEKAGVEGLVSIRQGDALKVEDLDRATVVALYMLPEFQEKLRPLLRKALKPGVRVVAHDYPLGDWEPAGRFTAEVQMPQGFARPHTLYLWRVVKPGK